MRPASGVRTMQTVGPSSTCTLFERASPANASPRSADQLGVPGGADRRPARQRERSPAADSCRRGPPRGRRRPSGRAARPARPAAGTRDWRPRSASTFHRVSSLRAGFRPLQSQRLPTTCRRRDGVRLFVPGVPPTRARGHTTRRGVAGSITSSISKYSATCSALPCSYARSTIASNAASRSASSAMASSSRRKPKPHRTLEPHATQLTGRPRHREDRPMEDSAGHGLRAQPVALAQDHAAERHRQRGPDDEHAADVAHQRRLLRLRSDHEARRVAQRNDGQAERLARAAGTAPPCPRGGVDRAGQMHGVVGDDTDRPALDAGQRRHHPRGEVGPTPAPSLRPPAIRALGARHRHGAGRAARRRAAVSGRRRSSPSTSPWK